MLEELQRIPAAWRSVRGSRSFRNQLVFALLLFVVAHLHNFYCLRIWQERPGTVINDIILNLLPPSDFSLPIFFFEYSALLLAVLFIIPYPDRLVKGLQMYALMIVARTVSIYLVPLEPPRDMVALWDPMANLFLHTSTTFVTKDLFFSGHIATLSLVLLLVENRYVKSWIFFCTVVVGSLILWQHVHYSTDVAFAPLVSYAAYRFVLYIHRQTQYGLEVSNSNY